MKSRITVKVTLVIAVLWFVGTSQVFAQLFFKKHDTVPEVALASDDHVLAGRDAVSGYGHDPHFVYNPYPWHAPAMYSGFRHYHLPPPVEHADISFTGDGQFPSLDDQQDPRTAYITVHLPEDAEVWIANIKTKQKGTLRRFVSQPLEPGQKISYEIKATWQEGPNKVEQTRQVELYPGTRSIVDFMAPAEEEIAPLPRRMP